MEDTKKEIKVTNGGINIEVKGIITTLTLEEAKELYGKLGQAIGIVIPYNPGITQPYNPFGPNVRYTSSAGDPIESSYISSKNG